nr:ribonuclease H-like domain-containing protein [Tanacetum cinerariifolium]
MVKSSSSSENEPCCSKSCKKNTDSLNSKITDLEDKLFDAKNMIYHYKLGMAQVDARLAEQKDRELKYCEKIRGLEYKTESSDEYIQILKKKLDLIKKEKEGYSVVPPPLAQIYSSPKKDLSWTDLPEFKDDTTEASHSTISFKPAIKFMKAAERPTTADIDANAETIFVDEITKEYGRYDDQEMFDTDVLNDEEVVVEDITTATTPAGNPQFELQEKGVNYSRCSRHMTGNMSYLFKYEEINGGYVAFGGDLKRGKITGRDFRLPDESQVLLRVPTKNNMYNVDLKNVSPSGVQQSPCLTRQKILSIVSSPFPVLFQFPLDGRPIVVVISSDRFFSPLERPSLEARKGVELFEVIFEVGFIGVMGCCSLLHSLPLSFTAPRTSVVKGGDEVVALVSTFMFLKPSEVSVVKRVKKAYRTGDKIGYFWCVVICNKTKNKSLRLAQSMGDLLNQLRHENQASLLIPAALGFCGDLEASSRTVFVACWRFPTVAFEGLYARNDIKAKGNEPFVLALVDGVLGEVVTTSVGASIEAEIVILEGDSDNDKANNLSSVDGVLGEVVTTSVGASIEAKIVILEGDSDNDKANNLSSGKFNKKIARE